MVNDLKGLKVVGIKRTENADKSRVYITYFCLRPWTDYELENSSALDGHAVEEVSTSEDFPIQIGDVVKFYYGKPIISAKGTFAPVTDYKLIESAVFPENKKK